MPEGTVSYQAGNDFNGELGNISF